MPRAAIHLRAQGGEARILAELPDDLVAKANLPAYFEMASYKHYRLMEHYSPTSQFYTKPYPGEPIARHLLPVNEALFQEYPLTDAAYPVVRSDLFDALVPFLERKLFGIKEFTFE
jgi:hypothetical protein